MTEREDLIAPEGKLWVCIRCGKTSPHRYGALEGASLGWDASCMLNSFLFPTEKLVFNPETMRVVEVQA